MVDKGIIVGCDRNQEWLLPWWWEHYRAHNEYPVVFVDFGMTSEALAWCKIHGECLSLPTSRVMPASKSEVLSKTKKNWEDRYGENIWSARKVWFKKPAALLQSPFECTIWLDLDCQVKDSLDPIFNCLNFGVDIALVSEPEHTHKLDQLQNLLLPGEVHYNSGVLAYRSQANILHQWAELALTSSEQFSGDQQVLSRAIHVHQPSLFQLPPIYNWSHALGPNPEAKIHHFHSHSGMQAIRKMLDL